MGARYERADWYDAPRYYDLLMREDTDLEASFLEAVAARHGRSDGNATLEPACGSGRLVVELARRGRSVVGLDRSAAMARYARERLAAEGLAGGVFVGAMEGFHLRRRFDLAHCLVSTFKHLLDEASARSHLRCVARALRPGGLYVLGLHLTQYDWDRRQRERWVAADGPTRVTCNLQSWPADRRRRRELVRSRLVVEENGAVRRLESLWDFRTYDARQLRRLLASVPELEHVATHDFTYDPERERELDDEQLDSVLVLRRRRGRLRRRPAARGAGCSGSRGTGSPDRSVP